MGEMFLVDISHINTWCSANCKRAFWRRIIVGNQIGWEISPSSTVSTRDNAHFVTSCSAPIDVSHVCSFHYTLESHLEWYKCLHETLSEENILSKIESRTLRLSRPPKNAMKFHLFITNVWMSKALSNDIEWWFALSPNIYIICVCAVTHLD